MLAAESRWTTHYLQLCRVHSAPQNGHREWEWREWKHTVTHVKRAKSTQAIMSFGSRWINAKYEHSACPTHFHRLSHSHSTECIQKRQRPATVRDRIQGTRRKRRESVNVFHIFIFLFFFLSLLLLVLGLYISLFLSLSFYCCVLRPIVTFHCLSSQHVSPPRPHSFHPGTSQAAPTNAFNGWPTIKHTKDAKIGLRDKRV